MTRKIITRLIKYIINKIMNGFLMKYDKNMVLNTKTSTIYFQKLIRYAHIH